MPSVFRCLLCFAAFRNRRRRHYSGSVGFCPGVLEIAEMDLGEIVLADIARRKTRSKRDRTKLIEKRKLAMPPKVMQGCQECEDLGDLCAQCRHKKMKRDWMRAKRAQLKQERRAAAASIAGLFGVSPPSQDHPPDL